MGLSPKGKAAGFDPAILGSILSSPARRKNTRRVIGVPVFCRYKAILAAGFGGFFFVDILCFSLKSLRISAIMRTDKSQFYTGGRT